ncbi:MFS transporter [Sanguibacter antarcticus]|uniref:MFS transporter n=1 Tax=Sanguibacter antarcticus TaxID=372484 RepID=UPI001FE49A8C|nr:MFS transporter [Sanguibacter antarcticus]
MTYVEAEARSESSTRHGRRAVLSWALWDWGSAAFNAVVTTFVFTRWLTSSAFVAPDVVDAAERGGDGSAAQAALDAVLASHSSWLGWGIAAAGLLIAVLAPVLGSRSDDTGRRRLWLGLNTAVVVLLTATMFFITPDPQALDQNLVLGIVLLSLGNIFFELASVSYNAMISQVSTPATLGKVSGLGWGAGYLGGIVLLLILFVGFINPDVGWFGVTSDNGLDVRVAVLVSAVWFGVFAIPVMRAVPEVAASGPKVRISMVEAYRNLGRDVAALWRADRRTVWFLLASAVFRDGLAGVFTFGGIIASVTFGFSASGVIVFAIGANIVAGLATIVAGYVEDRIGGKPIIVTSLVGMIVAGTVLLVLHDGGATVFWIFGLMLCVFVGPAQSASRALLARLAPVGREGEMFGLYATTGRAASFLAPSAFALSIMVFGAQYWGILGLVVVLGAGLALLVPVRTDDLHRAKERAAG